MYEKCVGCNKFIAGSDDCRLVAGADGKIITYCRECYEKRLKHLPVK